MLSPPAQAGSALLPGARPLKLPTDAGCWACRPPGCAASSGGSSTPSPVPLHLALPGPGAAVWSWGSAEGPKAPFTWHLAEQQEPQGLGEEQETGRSLAGGGGSAAAETHAGLRPRRGWKGAGAPPPVLAEGEEQGVGAAGTSLRAGRREKASFDPGHGAAQADRALPQAPVGGEEEAVSQGAGTWGGRPKQARAQPARCRVGSSRTEQGRGGMGWRGHREVTCRLRWARACG